MPQTAVTRNDCLLRTAMPNGLTGNNLRMIALGIGPQTDYGNPAKVP